MSFMIRHFWASMPPVPGDVTMKPRSHGGGLRSTSTSKTDGSDRVIGIDKGVVRNFAGSVPPVVHWFGNQRVADAVYNRVVFGVAVPGT